MATDSDPVLMQYADQIEDFFYLSEPFDHY